MSLTEARDIAHDKPRKVRQRGRVGAPRRQRGRARLQAYDFFAKHRKMMKAWAKLCMDNEDAP